MVEADGLAWHGPGIERFGKMRPKICTPETHLRLLFVVLVLLMTSCNGYRRGQMKQLYSQFGQVCELLLCHKSVYGSYPKSLAELETVVADSTICDLDASPLDELIEADPWRGRIYYLSTGTHYILWSEGADGKMDGTWPLGLTGAVDWSRDTVLFDGVSIQWNEGETSLGCEPIEYYDEEARRVFGALIPALKAGR